MSNTPVGSVGISLIVVESRACAYFRDSAAKSSQDDSTTILSGYLALMTWEVPNLPLLNSYYCPG